MKLRIIKKCGLFYPQFFKKGRYSDSWCGFGLPNVKYTTLEQAKKFLVVVEESCDPCVGECNKVVFQNFSSEKLRG